MQKLTDKNSSDYQGGIRGYTENVGKCPACGRPTNLIYEAHPFINGLVACSSQCAKNLVEFKLKSIV